MNDVIKKPHTKDGYDSSRLEELARCIVDPIYFIETYVMVQHPIKGAVPLKLFPYQKDMIKAFNENRFAIIMAGRQQGKTTIAAAFILWKTTFTPDFTVLIVANIRSQALEITARIAYSYESLPDWLRAGVTEYNKGSISFDNASRIVSRATTPNAGRGLSISLLFADELAFIAPNIQRDFWTAVTPTLSTGGSAIITSTPKNDLDQFSTIWKGAIDTTDEFGNQNPNGVGKNGFYALKSIWSDHPERDEEWAKPFRESLGEARFKQEYCCEFISDDETLINYMLLSKMRPKSPLYYTGTVRWYEEPQPNRTYIAALDPSMGTGYDFSTIQVFEAPSMRQVAEWQHNHTDPKGQVRMMMQILMIINQTLLEHPEQSGQPDIFWTVENNSLGEAVLQIIDATGEEKFPGVFVSEKRKKGTSRRFRKGMNTDNRKKYSACARFKTMIESGRCQISSQNLINELKVFVRGGGSFKAKQGEHDDLVMSTLLCIRMLETVTDWLDDSKANQLREIISEDDATEPMPMSF